MGMGGAAIAVVNDETALLINPNGLARLRETYGTVLDLEVTSTLDTVNEVGALTSDAIEPEAIYEELQGNLDTSLFVRAQTFPSVAMKNFGFGLLAKYDIHAERRSSDQNLDLNYVSDWAFTMGYNHSFWGGIVKLGANARLIDRVEFSGLIDPAVDGLDLQNLANGGMGVGVDVGFSLTSPTSFLPTLTLLARNVGDTSFNLGDGFRDYQTNQELQKMPFQVDAAVALFPIHSRNFRSTLTVQMNDLQAEGVYEDAVRRLHVGWELNMADSWFFRAGYNQGYFTGGLEWATVYTQLQLAYYGEEIGTDENPVQEDRVALKLLFRF